jgi:NAD(P)-dependent dehydrogenase (short-subunit alcohol dehydrogenase family)
MRVASCGISSPGLSSGVPTGGTEGRGAGASFPASLAAGNIKSRPPHVTIARPGAAQKESTAMHKVFDLSGRVAIVTGSGRGLGKAMATGRAEAGAKVVVCARTASDVEAVAAALRDRGLAAHALAFDATDRESCKRLVAATVQHYGRLDVMLVNHGVGGGQPAEAIDAASWDAMLAGNLTGAFNCAQAGGRQMLAQGGGGSIIFTSSTSSLVAFRDLTAYGASKAGVDQLVRQLAVEWGDRGIRVNAINPGYTTVRMRGSENRPPDPAMDEEIRRMTPMARRGRPEEFVGPAIFLASEASSFVTGVVLPVDGGYCAM